MMKKACIVVDDYMLKNNIFKTGFHRDNVNHCFVELRKAFKQHGFDLSTQDINQPEDSEIIFYAVNMPKTFANWHIVDKSYIWLMESEFICPENYNLQKHKYFRKIFTWSDDLVDGERYVKLNYATYLPKIINKNLSQKRKLCVLISGNKKPNSRARPALRKLDLYSEREKIIRWFEQHHPEDFDLYGVGWDKYRFSGSLMKRVLNLIPFFPEMYLKVTGRTYQSYKGAIAHKKPVMENYRFSICFENARDISGYITEKIFDSFIAGCVPIYWGANNISAYIPSNCFIDMRDFKSYELLYEFLVNMPDKVYLNYLINIEDFLLSARSRPFRSEGFVQTVIETIFEGEKCN